MIEIGRCPACGARTRRRWRNCLRCGAEQTVEQVPRPSPTVRLGVWLPSAATVLVSLGILFTIGRTGERSPSHDRGAKTADSSGTRASIVAISRSAPTETEPAASPKFMDSVRAGLAAYREGDLEASLASDRRAVEEQPLDADSLNNLGLVLTRLDRAAEALAFFDRAIALAPTRWAFRFNRARALGLLGDWDRSAKEYRAAGRLFPDDYVTTYNLALTLQRSGDEPAAAAEFERAVRLAPGEPSLHLSLAASLDRLGRAAEARREYGRYLDLEPDSPQREGLRNRIRELAELDPRQPET